MNLGSGRETVVCVDSLAVDGLCTICAHLRCKDIHTHTHTRTRSRAPHGHATSNMDMEMVGPPARTASPQRTDTTTHEQLYTRSQSCQLVVVGASLAECGAKARDHLRGRAVPPASGSPVRDAGGADTGTVLRCGCLVAQPRTGRALRGAATCAPLGWRPLRWRSIRAGCRSALAAARPRRRRRPPAPQQSPGRRSGAAAWRGWAVR